MNRTRTRVVIHPRTMRTTTGGSTLSQPGAQDTGRRNFFCKLAIFHHICTPKNCFKCIVVTCVHPGSICSSSATEDDYVVSLEKNITSTNR